METSLARRFDPWVSWIADGRELRLAAQRAHNAEVLIQHDGWMVARHGHHPAGTCFQSTFAAKDHNAYFSCQPRKMRVCYYAKESSGQVLLLLVPLIGVGIRNEQYSQTRTGSSSNKTKG
jgi:hypothetical protein